MDTLDEKFHSALRQGHLKLTEPREIIWQRLATLGKPVTLNELHRLCAPEASGTAVYRTLKVFLHFGLVYQVKPVPPSACPRCAHNSITASETGWRCNWCQTFERFAPRFAVAREGCQHLHLQCRDCGQVIARRQSDY